MDKLEHYLDQVCRGVGGPRALRQHIRQELREHLLDAAAGYQSTGLSQDESLSRAIDDFGAPEQVGSELAATHGHRLFGVVIDKAMNWKEKTLKARWLWASWALLVVVGVLAMEVVSILIAGQCLVPKFERFSRQDWIQADNNSTLDTLLFWAIRFLHRVWEAGRYGVVIIAAAVGLWALFEWRVRSENKSLMRLAGLGTVALGLMVVLVLTAAALIIPMQVTLPGLISRPTEGIVEQQVARIDDAVAALEQSIAQKRWGTAGYELDRASREINKLASLGGAAPAISAVHEQAKVNEFRERLRAASNSLDGARAAIWGRNWGLLQGELQEFRKQYAPIQKAVANPVGPAPGG